MKKYEIAYHNYAEAKAHIKGNNNLFKPCKWLCALSQDNHVGSKQ